MARYFEKLHKMTIVSPDETNTFDFMNDFIKWATSESWGLDGRTSKLNNWLQGGDSSLCI